MATTSVDGRARIADDSAEVRAGQLASPTLRV
jgi:hypothetical protein